jgi:hypothetical protein
VAAALASSPGAAWAGDTKPAVGSRTATGSKTAAPTPPPPQGTVDERASKWLSQGNKAFKDGKFVEAEKAYREAFNLKQVYDIAGNLAMAEFAQSKHRDAAEHLALAIRLFPVTGDPATRTQMQKTFDQCKGSVGSVKVVVSTTRGAQVSVDGKAVGEAPLEDDVYLDPGKHTISVTAKGYKDASKSVDVVKGVASTVKLELVLLPPEVVVKNGPPPPPPPRSKVPTIVLGAAAFVAAGVGGALFAVSKGKESDANTLIGTLNTQKRHCLPSNNNTDADCIAIVDGLGSADTLHNAAIGMFIGAGAAGAAALGYFIWSRPGTKKTTGLDVKATPVAGAGHGGVVISGTF